MSVAVTSDNLVPPHPHVNVGTTGVPQGLTPRQRPVNRYPKVVQTRFLQQRDSGSAAGMSPKASEEVLAGLLKP
jgi:hypothetical protein